jgi:hypothetical protein
LWGFSIAALVANPEAEAAIGALFKHCHWKPALTDAKQSQTRRKLDAFIDFYYYKKEYDKEKKAKYTEDTEDLNNFVDFYYYEK